MEKYKVSDPMRRFTLVVSALFAAGGLWLIASGDSFGRLVAGFFGLCFLIAVFEPWFARPWVICDYRLMMTKDEVACEHPKRQRESIRWEDVNRIWYVTTSDGPRLPDEWLLLEGDQGGCSFPTEAIGFNRIWDELKQRFAGFDYKPIILGGEPTMPSISAGSGLECLRSFKSQTQSEGAGLALTHCCPCSLAPIASVISPSVRV